MATIPLFWNTNMAAVTSCENALLVESQINNPWEDIMSTRMETWHSWTLKENITINQNKKWNLENNDLWFIHLSIFVSHKFFIHTSYHSNKRVIHFNLWKQILFCHFAVKH